MKKQFRGILRLIKRHRGATALIFLALLVASAVLWDSFSAQLSDGLPELTIKKKPVEKMSVAPLSGLRVKEDVAKKTPIAIVVENHPESRPQSGLNKADIVYETFAEGGITRFLAIYQSQEPPAQIGPVRSARPYFVEWAKSYEALFAHVGGSIDALDLIKARGIYDINQFNFPSTFWRDRTRRAPHNVYTTLARIEEAAQTKNYPSQNQSVPSYLFKPEPKKEERPESFSFRVQYNNAFGVTYTYLPEENTFKRAIAGYKHMDKETGEQLAAKNVLIGFSNFSYGRTRYNEQKVDIVNTGSGSAIAYVNGKRQQATWKRLPGGPLKFYSQEGSEIALSPGTTWISFVPTGTPVN
jgi:hypothetical protein